MWLFHFHSMVNMQPFCPAFPPAVRSWLSLWNFKEKASTASMTQPFRKNYCAFTVPSRSISLSVLLPWRVILPSSRSRESNSSCVSETSAAPRFSIIRSSRRIPGIGTMKSFYAASTPMKSAPESPFFLVRNDAANQAGAGWLPRFPLQNA